MNRITPFDLFLLDTQRNNDAVALGRRGPDTAIEPIPLGKPLKELVDFGRRIGKSVVGAEAQRPTADELHAFGEKLFDFLFRGKLRQLYARLPSGPISMQILSNRPELREVPWEYVVTPDRVPVPHRDRSVIRVHPTCGVQATPVKAKANLRVLFVSADPVDQDGVQWSDLQPVIERTFRAWVPSAAPIEFLEGMTRNGLLEAVNRKKFDVFHFFGHGELVDGVGHLILQDPRTGQSDRISAEDLAVALAGKQVQLAILSACQSSAGRNADDFGTVATSLICSGIPAVVANQYNIPTKAIAPFVGAIYQALLDGETIDEAVAGGRVALKVGLGATTGKGAMLEWGIPTLHRLADAQNLFERAP